MIFCEDTLTLFSLEAHCSPRCRLAAGLHSHRSRIRYLSKKIREF